MPRRRLRTQGPPLKASTCRRTTTIAGTPAAISRWWADTKGNWPLHLPRDDFRSYFDFVAAISENHIRIPMIFSSVNRFFVNVRSSPRADSTLLNGRVSVAQATGSAAIQLPQSAWFEKPVRTFNAKRAFEIRESRRSARTKTPA